MTIHRTLEKVAVLGCAAGGLLLAAPAARAQTVVSTVNPTVRGVVTAPGAEQVVCSGRVKVTSKAVATSPTTPPQLKVLVDARGLSCSGATTGAAYVNDGYANVSRPFASQDVIRTTFALYRNAPGDRSGARTALLTLNLSYNASTWTLSNGTGGLGDL